MFKDDALEAAPIMQRALHELLAVTKTSGDWGADLRMSCNRLILNCPKLIQEDEAGPPMIECFDLARNAGANAAQVEAVRQSVEAETAVSVGARLIKNCLIRTCLLTQSRIISGMAFKSRDDVEALMLALKDSFNDAEEIAADEMDQMSYRALVELHAAVIFYLVGTARPLPRMVRFEFARPMPSLQIAQRLYYDAGRADELRNENKVVHPAFMRPYGRALSA